ncbi:hypothetical protein HJFPF1_09393 [Paramyrothecium foliicola]|nr:hypothetical protein HJFPF1_09393 [Paramyrothecium foliicola]
MQPSTTIIIIGQLFGGCDIMDRLVSGLNLVVASNDLGVRRGNTIVIGATLAIRRHTLLLRLRSRVVLGGAATASRTLGTVVHTGVLSTRLALLLVLVARRSLNVDVGNAATLLVLRQRLVLVGRFGVLRDDVPGVQEAGNITEDGEEDVDERVGAADTALDPDYGMRVSKRYKSAVRRSDAMRYVPGRGGKRTAKRPRKMSAEHMAFVVVEANCLRCSKYENGGGNKNRTIMWLGKE